MASFFFYQNKYYDCIKVFILPFMLCWLIRSVPHDCSTHRITRTDIPIEVNFYGSTELDYWPHKGLNKGGYFLRCPPCPKNYGSLHCCKMSEVDLIGGWNAAWKLRTLVLHRHKFCGISLAASWPES